jgi:ribosomal protein S18 acetylase RimI-like enzyme
VIEYQTGLSGIDAGDLEGFFDGWPSAPDGEGLLRILTGSAFVVLAREGDQVVGFINALSDGDLAVYIPLLEVRASHRGQGIGSELVRRVLSRFDRADMVDAVCDAGVAPFYERVGMVRLTGMAHRNREAPVLRPMA